MASAAGGSLGAHSIVRKWPETASQPGEVIFLKAIVFDVDGTLIESMSIGSDLYFSSILAVLGPFPTIHGATKYVASLRHSKEHKVAIATGGWRSSALLKLETSGFDVNGIPVASCDDSESRAEIMRVALAKLGNEFESVTYFGDAEWDRQACQTLGWDFAPVGSDLGGIQSYDGVDL